MASRVPYILIDASRWRSDAAVSMCSPAARGLWIDLLCAFHENNDGEPIQGTVDAIAALCRCQRKDVIAGLRDIGEHLTLVEWSNGEVVIHQRAEPTESRLDLSQRAWQKLRCRVIERDGLICKYCGIDVEVPTIDHVLPLSRGGRSTMRNCVVACGSCNSSKNNKTLREWSGRRGTDTDNQA